jgi:hypothetical protein
LSATSAAIRRRRISFGAKPGKELGLNGIIRGFEKLSPPPVPRHWRRLRSSQPKRREAVARRLEGHEGLECEVYNIISTDELDAAVNSLEAKNAAKEV